MLQWIPLHVLLQGLRESLNSRSKSLRGKMSSVKKHRLIMPRLWLKLPMLMRHC